LAADDELAWTPFKRPRRGWPRPGPQGSGQAGGTAATLGNDSTTNWLQLKILISLSGTVPKAAQVGRYHVAKAVIVNAVIVNAAMTSCPNTASPQRHQAADALRRARKLPVGPDRNELRQFAIGLLWREEKGFSDEVAASLTNRER
jgi:hypothetical protein